MTISQIFLRVAGERAAGAVSYFDGSNLHISAAGIGPGTYEERAFVTMSRERLDHAARSDDPLSEILHDPDGGSGLLPPGIETLLHYLMPQSYVVHVRSPQIAGLLAGTEGERHVSALFGGDALWVATTPPTNELFHTVKAAISASEKTDPPCPYLFMQNHGLLVGADSPEGIERACRKVEEAVHAAIGRHPRLSPMRRDTHDLMEFNEAVRRAFADTRAAHGFALNAPVTTACANPEIDLRAESEERFRPVSRALLGRYASHLGRALCFVPRHSDLTSPQALLADVLHSIHDFSDSHDAAPRVVVIQGGGAVIVGDTEEELAKLCSAFSATLETACYAESFGGAGGLSDQYFEALIEASGR